MMASVGISQNKAYISTEKAIADINYMIKNIEDIHYSPYFKIEKQFFDKSVKATLSAFYRDSIPLKTFIASNMKLSALLSGGHTGLDWQNDKIYPELISYQFLPFTGKLIKGNTVFIVTRSVNDKIPVGIELTKINGLSIVELYKECMSFIGGIDTFKNANCERLFPLYLFFTDKLKAPYNIHLTDRIISLKGLNVQGLNDFLVNGNSIDNYTFEIIDDNIGLISYNSCTDYSAFEVFLSKTFSEIDDKKINKLIIDIRENSGGDSKLNDLLLSYITTKPYRQSSGRFWKVSSQAKVVYKKNNYSKHHGKSFMEYYYNKESGTIIEDFDSELINPIKPSFYFTGKTCFLIGPKTFSSANFLADAVKTYNLSTLIGTSTGELTNDFGELIDFKLPYSGNIVYVSSTYDIGAKGNPKLFEPVYPDINTYNDALQYAIKWIE